MNRKQIILAVIALVSVIVIASVVFILSRFHKVEIVLERPGITATVSRFDVNTGVSTEVSKLDSDKTLHLTKGSYYIEPAGENINTSQINFTVDSSSKTVRVDPTLSDEYYAQILNDEKSAIHKVITSTYPDRFKKGNVFEYKFVREQIYLEGDWYGAVLGAKLSDPRDVGDNYRLVLHKTDGKWKIVAQPELVLSAIENPDIPKSILDDINKLVG